MKIQQVVLLKHLDLKLIPVQVEQKLVQVEQKLVQVEQKLVQVAPVMLVLVEQKSVPVMPVMPVMLEQVVPVMVVQVDQKNNQLKLVPQELKHPLILRRALLHDSPN